uniref:Uncharacterized protein n=1 Tax=Anopheles farauti TaxID=69004 RepID=A0A182Q533_9DIPT
MLFHSSRKNVSAKIFCRVVIPKKGSFFRTISCFGSRSYRRVQGVEENDIPGGATSHRIVLFEHLFGASKAARPPRPTKVRPARASSHSQQAVSVGRWDEDTVSQSGCECPTQRI